MMGIVVWSWGLCVLLAGCGSILKTGHITLSTTPDQQPEGINFLEKENDARTSHLVLNYRHILDLETNQLLASEFCHTIWYIIRNITFGYWTIIDGRLIEHFRALTLRMFPVIITKINIFFFFLQICTVHLDISSFIYSPTDTLVRCLKKQY